MIDKNTIQKRIRELGKGGTTSFTKAELGREDGGVIVGREDYNGADGPLYRLYHCGDPLGQYSQFDATNLVEKMTR